MRQCRHCEGLSRSRFLHRAAAEAGRGLPAIEPGMPMPAGTGLSRRAFVARGLGALAGLAPWALFVLYASRQGVWMSLSQLESFPDTYNPGYFLVKLALWVLAGLLFLQAIVDVVRPRSD